MSRKVIVTIDNSNCKFKLKYVGRWSYNGDASWQSNNSVKDIEPGEKIDIILNSDERGGLHYIMYPYGNGRALNLKMAFINPSSASKAQGSEFCGLQHYDRWGGETFKVHYKIGEPNKACWEEGDKVFPELKCFDN
ncbi:hypothetical protein [Tenacibaculum ascidiaceicola]|uniref:hypothetical protein n=1 Tax=Tenacibaculum ascidiaceicola TaxID=1699411 RepID=UPI003895BCF3